MPITPLPTPPSRADAANFAARGDAFLGALPTFQEEANDLEENVNAKESSAVASASGALASQSAASTSASNAAVSSAASAASAASALAAAAATQAGLPAQTSTNGLSLVSALGVAGWGTPFGPGRQIRRTSASENQIADSSALNYASWTTGPNTTLLFDQTAPGPNGLRSAIAINTTGGSAYVAWVLTPVQGQTRTISVWWRGTTKPSVGQLLIADYRDAANVSQRATLNFSDPSIIADGVWRRYTLTWTHAGSNVTPMSVFTCVDTGNNTQNFADPQVNVGGTAAAYVATGANHLLEPYQSYEIDSTNGVVGLTLPASGYGATADAFIGLKDIGRVASTNNITVGRNGGSIEGSAQDLEVDINGVSLRLVMNTAKGWLIK